MINYGYSDYCKINRKYITKCYLHYMDGIKEHFHRLPERQDVYETPVKHEMIIESMKRKAETKYHIIYQMNALIERLNQMKSENELTETAIKNDSRPKSRRTTE